MPSGPDELRTEFMQSCPACGNTINDGIETAEQRIKNAGGTINRGFIDFPAGFDLAAHDDVLRAVSYLVLEWDYDRGVPPERAKESVTLSIDTPPLQPPVFPHRTVLHHKLMAIARDVANGCVLVDEQDETKYFNLPKFLDQMEHRIYSEVETGLSPVGNFKLCPAEIARYLWCCLALDVGDNPAGDTFNKLPIMD